MAFWRVLGLLTLIYSLQSSEAMYWPASSYGIPKAASGCPYADGFQWLIGRRYQDTENDNPKSHKSPRFHLDATVDRKKGIVRSFCMKTDTSTDTKRGSWPLGKYCIYKKGGSCPTNLTPGFIKWDDQDSSKCCQDGDGYCNKNNETGKLPDGKYDENTKIEFCCRTDGDKNDPISLPSLKPFFLLAYDSAECQQVKWAVVSVEWIRFDNENNRNEDGQGGSHPHGARIDDHKIHYCYYQGCNKTLSGLSGTFHSPNYPQKYPDGQYCSWRITVSQTQKIHLTFSNFSLQSDNNTDSLYVYDGENATGEVLGVFHGGHPPPKEGINSLSSHMFVIFKSDKKVSYTGFNASYNALAFRSTVNVATSTLRSRKLTPSPSVRLSPSRWTSITSSYNTEPIMTSSKTGPAFVTSYYTKPTKAEPSEPTTPLESTEPTKKGGQTGARGKSEGVNVTAVAAPLVSVLVLIAVLLAAGFYCYKRKKVNKNDTESKESILMSELPLSIDNPCYLTSDEGSNDCDEVKAPKENEMKPMIEQESYNPLHENNA